MAEGGSRGSLRLADGVTTGDGVGKASLVDVCGVGGGV